MDVDRQYVAVAAVLGIFLLVQLGALALVEPFKSAGLQDVEDPSDPTNSLLYIGAILVATAVMLVAFKYGGDGVIRALLVFSSGYLAFYVFGVFFALLPAVALALGIMAALWVHPEWYVIDGAGVIMGAGAAGLFGINFGVFPALVLLTVLAVYDAISVYGTEHMLTLAEGVMDLKVPVVLVIPLSLSYSFIDAEAPDATSGDEDETATDADTTAADGAAATAADGGAAAGSAAAAADGTDADSESGDTDTGAEDDADPMERDAFFIGLGDAVMPSVMVASAGFFAPAGIASLVPGIALTLPALTAMIGTNVGLLILMYLVMQGRAHAGLPLLNGGAIAGYLVGALAAGVPLVRALGIAPYV